MRRKLRNAVPPIHSEDALQRETLIAVSPHKANPLQSGAYWSWTECGEEVSVRRVTAVAALPVCRLALLRAPRLGLHGEGSRLAA